MRKTYFVAFSSLGLLLVLCRCQVSAQTSISYGQCVDDTIRAVGEIDRYTFQGSAGEVVIIRLATSWRFYAHVRLFFGGNEFRRESGEFGLRIDTLRLVSTGTHEIWVLDDNGFETGNYTFCIQRVVNPVGAIALSYGQTVRDTLRQRAQMRTYTFSAVSNVPVIIRIAGSWRFYPQAEIYNSNGRRMYLSAGEFGLRLDTLNLPAGSYSLFVLDDNGHETGDFDLHVQRTINPAGSRTISYGQTLQDSINRRSLIRSFVLSAVENDIVILRLCGSWRFYPQLEIYNPAGRRIHLSAGEFGLRVDTLRLSAGTYSVFVLDDNGHENGTFWIHLQRTVNPIPSIPLAENVQRRDTLRVPCETKAYTFTTTRQNCRVTIRMQASWRFYPQFELYNPGGRRLALVAGEFLAELSNFLLADVGTYVLHAMDDNGFETGNYTITYVPTCPTDGLVDQYALPTEYVLHHNYPNPFNPETKIKFEIPVSNDVSLKVFDLLGREVKTLLNERLQPGRYETTFDGSGLASGVYLYRLQAGGFVKTKKLILLQ